MCNQHRERLFYEGIERGMENEPLGVYFRYAGIKPVFNWGSTALYRGYIGTWEIADQRLYLIGLKGNLRKDRLAGGEPVNVGTFFPDHPDRVFAHWYSGTIELPQGEILERDGWMTTYEQDLLIRLKKGIVINTEVRVNKTKAERVAEFRANLPPGVEYDDDIPFGPSLFRANLPQRDIKEFREKLGRLIAEEDKKRKENSCPIRKL